jgi:hypothetical protein
MKDYEQQQREDFADWCQKWDKAKNEEDFSKGAITDGNGNLNPQPKVTDSESFVSSSAGFDPSFGQDREQEQRGDFDDWCEKWEKAKSDGVFENAPNHFVPSQKTANVSFFGATNSDPSDGVSERDADYWNTVHNMSANGELAPKEVFTESVIDKEGIKKVADAIRQSPNPIRPNTIGPDQELEPEQLGVTYSEEDLEKIEEAKAKLHEMGDKINSLLGLGKRSEAMEKKMESLKEKLDKLSDELSHSAPESISSGQAY